MSRRVRKHLGKEAKEIGTMVARKRGEPSSTRHACRELKVTRKRVGVLISGRGSNLQSLIDAARHPDYPPRSLR